MTSLDSLVSIFREKVKSVPEVAICSVTATSDGLTIDVPLSFVADALWENRNSLKKAAIESGFIGVIEILYEGRHYAPPIDLHHW